MINQMFLSRNQTHRPDVFMPGILNVGCYVGWIPLALAFVTIFTRPKKNWPVFSTAVIFLWIALGSTVPWNLWGVLHKVPGLSSLRLPSRFNVFVLLLLALLSGQGIQIIKEKLHKLKWASFVPLLIVAIVAIDLVWVNGEIFKVAFSVPPIKVQAKDDFKSYYESPYREQYIQRALYKTFSNWPSAAFPAVLENRGVIHNYRTVPFVSYAVCFEDPQYRGEAWMEGQNGKITNLNITPNRICVETNGLGEVLIININYDSGWKVAGKMPLMVFPRMGLIAIQLHPGCKSIELVYLPKSFCWGACISLIALFVVLGVILYQIIKKTKIVRD